METRYGWTTADDYRLFFHMPFLALVHGWNLAAGWHLREGAPYYAALQQTCGFEKGECLVVLFKPLSLLSRTAEFCVIDPADAATHALLRALALRRLRKVHLKVGVHGAGRGYELRRGSLIAHAG